MTFYYVKAEEAGNCGETAELGGLLYSVEPLHMVASASWSRAKKMKTGTGAYCTSRPVSRGVASTLWQNLQTPELTEQETFREHVLQTITTLAVAASLEYCTYRFRSCPPTMEDNTNASAG